MKILYYSPHPGLSLAAPTGYGTHMREMIAAFRRAGHTVDTLIRGGERMVSSTPKQSVGRHFKELAKRAVPKRTWESLKHKERIRSDKAFEAILAEQVRDLQPELIYERSAYLQPSGTNVATRLGIPHVLEINTPVNAERHYLGLPNSYYEDMAEQVEQQQLQQTSLAVVVSPAMIDYFVEKHQAETTKVICTPNGIDVNGFDVDQSAVDQVRSNLGLSGKQVVGFVGCMARWQRVDLLIDAIALLKSDHSDVVALMVGGSKDTITELRNRAVRLGVESRIFFTGSVPKAQVCNHISAMDICVLPDNLWYGSPTKIFEYGAMKKPTVAPDNITLRSIIEDGVHGRLVDGSPEALAKALDQLLTDRSLANRMGIAFYDRVRSEFTWDSNVTRIVAALENRSCPQLSNV